jgi:hypothetical protein
MPCGIRSGDRCNRVVLSQPRNRNQHAHAYDIHPGHSWRRQPNRDRNSRFNHQQHASNLDGQFRCLDSDPVRSGKCKQHLNGDGVGEFSDSPLLRSPGCGRSKYRVVGWDNTTAVVSSVTDSSGNTYKLALGPTLSQVMPRTQAIYYASGVSPASAGANTVTVTFNTAASYPDVRIVEYKGVTTLDAGATTGGNSANMDSGPATTTSAPELLFGANNMENWTNNSGLGYTQRIRSAWGNIVEDQVVSVAGPYDATAIQVPAAGWIMQLATFK